MILTWKAIVLLVAALIGLVSVTAQEDPVVPVHLQPRAFHNDEEYVAGVGGGEAHCTGHPFGRGVICDPAQDFTGWPAPEALPPQYLCAEEAHVDGNGETVTVTACRPNPAHPDYPW